MNGLLFADGVRLFSAAPTEDIFPGTCPPDIPAVCPPVVLHTARGGREGIQIGVQAGDRPLTGLTARCTPAIPGVTVEIFTVQLLPFSQNTIHIGSRSVRAVAPGLLPEVLRPQPVDVPAGECRALYLRVSAAPDAAPGEYPATLTVTADGFSAVLPIAAVVHRAVLPAPECSRFSYVCWTQLLEPEHLRRVYGIEPWSPEHETLLLHCGRVMRTQRQNVIDVPLEHVLADGLSVDADGTLRFDFTHLDRFLAIMRDPDGMAARSFSGMHLLSRDWSLDMPPATSWSQRGLIGWVFDRQPDGHFERVWKLAADPAVEQFHRTLFAALGAHLRAMGLEEAWLQHVADEIDSDIQYQQTLAVYRLIHELMPGARTIDAVRRESPYTFGRELDIHVPLLWHHAHAPQAYRAIPDGRAEVWQYTCLQPQFDYLSRLGDYPLAATRLLGWYNFLAGLTGYLHYAWNNYGPCVHRHDPYADVSCFGSFPCDAFIVYPDREGLSVFESLRSEAMRGALEDYELLCLAAQIAPQAVRAAAQVAVAAADEHTNDADFLFALREQLLNLIDAQ